MLMLDHHINDGALTPRQGHEPFYLFIYLTRIGDFFLIKVITTKIPCTRHGVSLVAHIVSQLFKFIEKKLYYKDTLHKVSLVVHIVSQLFKLSGKRL